MKNLRIAYLIGLPAFIAVIVMLILIFIYDMTYLSTWMILPILLLVVLYISESNIQWLFSKKNPPKLLEKEKILLHMHSYIYNGLKNEEELKRYEDRISLLRMTHKINTISDDSVPEDIKLLICMPIIDMTFYEENYFLKVYQRVVIYPHPFISPQYGDKFHISEIEHNDGVLIFSIEQLLPGLEKQMFNIVAYEWAQAYLFKRDRTTYVKCIDKKEVEENLIKVAYLDLEHLRKVIGLENIDLQAVALSLYFDRRELLEKHMPVTFKGIDKVYAEKKRSFEPRN